MSELYLTYSLDTPLGTLVFNPTGGAAGMYLTQVDGLDGASVRSTVENLPQRDGGYVYDSLRGPRYPVLTGEIHNTTTSSRLTTMENLLQYTDSIRTADGTLRWTPTGLTERGVTVRLMDLVTITTQGWLKSFQIPLVAADARAYATAQSTSNRSGTGNLTVTPGGTGDTYPTITVHGAITNPVVTNTTTGLELSTSGTISTSGSRTFDCKNETYIDGAGVNRIDSVVASASTFFTLKHGVANTISLSGTSTDPNTKLTVTWNDAYV